MSIWHAMVCAKHIFSNVIKFHEKIFKNEIFLGEFHTLSSPCFFELLFHPFKTDYQHGSPYCCQSTHSITNEEMKEVPRICEFAHFYCYHGVGGAPLAVHKRPHLIYINCIIVTSVINQKRISHNTIRLHCHHYLLFLNSYF